MISKYHNNLKIISFYLSYKYSNIFFENYDKDIILEILNELRYTNLSHLYNHYMEISLVLNSNYNNNNIKFNTNKIHIFDNHIYLNNVNSLLIFNKTKKMPYIYNYLKNVLSNINYKIYFADDNNILNCNSNFNFNNFICQINYNNNNNLDNILNNLIVNIKIYDIQHNLIGMFNIPYNNNINNINNINHIQCIFTINDINYTNIFNNTYVKNINLMYTVIPNIVKIL